MENIKTSFVFEEGHIRGFDVKFKDQDVCSAMHFIESTLRPTIEENKISGRLELRISSGKWNLAYIGIQPFEFIPVLVTLINTA